MAVLHISVSISCLSQSPIDMRMWESLGCGCQTLITWTRRIQAGGIPGGGSENALKTAQHAYPASPTPYKTAST